MEEPTTNSRSDIRAERRGSSRRGGPLAVALLGGLAVVAAFVLMRATSGTPNGTPAALSPGASSAPAPSGELGIGAVATLTDGAVARLNGVESGVVPDPAAPPETGLRLDRLDVEVCAGAADLFVDAAFWNGVGADGRVHSAHMGVRRFVTLTMSPGSCQRGSVDLAVPEDTQLAGVLLMDTSQTTAARWAVQGRAPAAVPLSSPVRPGPAAVGASVDLMIGGSATVQAVGLGLSPSTGSAAPGDFVTVEVEHCAGPEASPVSPGHWFLELEDNRLVTADADLSTLSASTLEAEACARGTIAFRIPERGLPAGVRYAYGGQFEQARWGLDR
jgi:hypothetical protein